MLGRSERESAAHVLAAARIGGWDVPHNRDELSDVLDLGSMTAALATVAPLAPALLTAAAILATVALYAWLDRTRLGRYAYEAPAWFLRVKNRAGVARTPARD